MNERNQLSLKLAASHIVLVLALLLVCTFLLPVSILALTVAQTVACILYLAGYWEFYGLRFRYLYSASLELVILLLLARMLSSGASQHLNLFLEVALGLVQCWLLLELFKVLLVIYKKEKSSLEIIFPFREGRYMITDGGNSRTSRLMNYHFHSVVHKRKKTNNSMKFAADIVKIPDNNSLYFPSANEDYPIFAEKIYSPMEGIIIKADDAFGDNIPYSGNYPYTTGNTVVIKKENLFLLLGHLKKDSIRVKEGDKVDAGELIGEAGNSGWTERPHLHMQLMESQGEAYWFGSGVSIQFNNKNLYKNRIIHV